LLPGSSARTDSFEERKTFSITTRYEPYGLRAAALRVLALVVDAAR
jgi:hypothetical protein